MPRYFTSLGSFSAYASLFNRARAFQLISPPRLCILPCYSMFLQGRVRTVHTIEANRSHNKSACGMLIEGHTPSRTRISWLVRRTLCPTQTSSCSLRNFFVCSAVSKIPFARPTNVIFRPVDRVGELPDLVRQSHTRPTGDNINWCVTYAGNVFCSLVPAPFYFETPEHSHLQTRSFVPRAPASRVRRCCHVVTAHQTRITLCVNPVSCQFKHDSHAIMIISKN